MTQDKKLPLKEQYLEYMRRFPFYKWAAKSIGKDEDTLLTWRKEDTDFADRVEIARSEGMKYWGGRASPDLILKSADPETFKDRVDLTSKGDQLQPLVIIKDGNSS